jgi:uncharacterized delta-60 repeat protein
VQTRALSRPRALLAAAALVAAAVTTLGAPSALAAAGDLDPTFGVGGRLAVDVADCEDEAGDIAEGLDGSLVAVGSSCRTEGTGEDAVQIYAPTVVRMTSTGVLDPAFGGDGIVTTADESGRLTTVAVDGTTGDIYAGGYVSQEVGDDALVLKYDASGGLVYRFSAHIGTAGNLESVDDIRLAGDGSVVAAGTTCSLDEDLFTCQVFAIHLTPAGVLDTSFSGDGKSLSSAGDFSGVHVLADGRVAAIEYHEASDSDRLRLFAADVASNAAGFATGTGGAAALPFEYGFGITSTSTHLFVAGEVFDDTSSDQAVAKYSLAGALDTTFGGGDGWVQSDLADDEYASEVAVGSDGTIYTAGGLNTGNAATVARYTAAGVLDPAFGEGGSVRLTVPGYDATSADAIIVQLDGKPVVAGAGFVEETAQLDMVLARFKAVTPFATRYTAVAPSRIFDTRPGQLTGDGRDVSLSAGERHDLKVTDKAGIPATGVSAVVMNVTAISPTTSGYLALFPAGSTFPGTSNLNFQPGQIVANLVTVKVGEDGEVTLLNSNGNTNVAVDVAGWYSDGESEVLGGKLKSLSPVRVLDSRPGADPTDEGVNAKLVPNQVITVDVSDVAPEPLSAVVINLTATSGTGSGNLRAYPSDAPTVPAVSNLNYIVNRTVANLAIVKVGPDGTIKIRNTNSTVHVLADVSGYFTTSANTTGTDGSFQPLTPKRILDTRSGLNSADTPIGAAASRVVQVSGRGRVPVGAKAVVLNVTAVNPTVNGFLTIYPANLTSRPLASNLNFTPGRTVPNSVIVQLSPTGAVRVYNSGGTTDVLFDVAGWYSS